MSNRLERASTYRDRAQELRAIAEEIQDQGQRKLLREVAQEYETMASSVSRQDVSALASKSF